jgi:dTDP-4-amino-4,6-dideoxygalactose transaminase/predicted O-linked N-acetylglucosamine transferase (SPINDLY family)
MTVSAAPPTPDFASLEQELAQIANQPAPAQWQAAEQRAILKIRRDQPAANYQLGMRELQARRSMSAIACLEAALVGRPVQQEYWRAYIDALIQAGRNQAARQVLELGTRHGLQQSVAQRFLPRLDAAAAPDTATVDTVLTLFGQARMAEVETLARSLTARFPQHGFGWKVLATVLHMQGQVEQALVGMQTAAQLFPDDAEVHNNLGLMLKGQGLAAQAEASLNRAILLKPDYVEAHNNLGIALQDLGRLTAAETSLRHALALKPDYAKAHNNLGITLHYQSRLAEARTAYLRALEIEPAYADAYSNLLFCLSQMEGIDADALFAEHLGFGERFEAPLRARWTAHGNTRDPQRRLRVGFVSGDLREHPVAAFIEPVLIHLADHPSLSLYAYSNHSTYDHVTQRLRGHFAHWHSVVGMNDDAMANRIRADGIDILIDLSGHTAHNRLLVFARKPAPVQATWIGYPGTTGLWAMDYYLTDRFLLPPGQFDHRFTEKLVHLPVSAPFSPPRDGPPVNSLPALANGYITFGSFNRPSKISPGVIAVWSQLLRALPTARMLLGAMPEDGDNDSFIAWFAEQGITRERLSFRRRSDMTAYLALHHEVDVCLDTFPYSGGTTTLHAMWMGVPTLTLAGDTAAGRQGACILEHSGLSQFVARDGADFVQKGLAIAADLPVLADLRGGLRDRFALPSSVDLINIANGVEQALRAMWQRWCAWLPAATFEVPPQASVDPHADLIAAAQAALAAPIYVTQPLLPPLHDFIPYLEQIWANKILTNGGQFHQQLEQALCAYLGVEHISLFTNGTIALMTALQALGIKGEVITTPYSFVATAHSLLWNGIKPVFVDIDPLSFNLDPEKIEAAITPATTAIMPVHCYGHPCDVERIQEIANRHGLKVIYDAAHAFGVRLNGSSVLNRGELSVLSFHATKVFNTFEGGAIICPDAATKRHIDNLKNFGIQDEVTVVAPGINGKMSEFNAAFGLLQLKGIDAALQKRRHVDLRYRAGLAGVAGIEAIAGVKNEFANHAYFPILVQPDYPLSRDGLYQKLRDAGIYARRYFFPLISEFPMYRDMASAASANLPVATRAAQGVICLPIYPDLEPAQTDRIVDLIRSA